GSPRINLLGLDAAGLASLVESWGDKPFRAKQLQRWLHQRGVDDFGQMTDLAKSFREKLARHCEVRAPGVLTVHKSADGTRKWLLDVGNGNAIETVFIPEDDRGTLCISTQAGCTVACRFCSAGPQGFHRTLGVDETVGQLWLARRTIEADREGARLANGAPAPLAATDDRVISNVVMMGM